MAYLSREEFDKSIEDCNTALSLNKDFVKVNLKFNIWIGLL